ncbi:hypothetical protein QBC41DRAFT_363511 [Cercophora samala]|uniref:Uncharacterized protein n=1 Tax=Cercophora samala TaxID=330535 RepID=A0AA39ZI97_9PEZI|nr:hypothetical protein QBC41DRAFT_363511 [Cercophora samala]
MADDPHNTSDISDPVEAGAAKEDAETTATRRELKQTSISEKAGQQPSTSQDDKSASDDDSAPKDKTTTGARKVTPPVALGVPSDDTLAEQISSPKKKRAHAELDENKDVAEAPLEGEGTAATDSKSTTAVTLNRTNRSEPEKKRPRDRQASASAVKSGQEEVEPLSASASPRSSMEELAKSPPANTATVRSPIDKPQPTSASAFASSGFAKLGASSASPFASAAGASPFASAGAGKPSVFGSAGTTSFGSVLGGSAAAAPAKLNFSSTSTASPFASALNGQAGGGSVFKSSPFGSAFGGASALSGGGARLTNFGKPGEALKSGKPAKPFGAPESDAEEDEKDEDGEEENGEGAGVDGEEDNKGDDEKEESERKRLKLHKIVVDDGESSEVTLFSQRAKMYVMEKGVGWKERGAGMLKVNVPRATVEFQNDGSPDATSFDASVLEDKDYSGPKNVRLIMRQDHTLRVILNTIVLPAMQFKIEKKLKAATVLFTAFENGEAQLVQMKGNDLQSGTLKRKRGRPPKVVPLATEEATPSPSPAQSPPPPSSSDPNNTTKPPPPKRKRQPKSKPPPPSPDVPPEPDIPLPGYFQHLVKLHSALSLVSTFLSTHSQHLPPTLSNLSKALTSKGVVPSIEDIAALKAITPGNIRFEYVDHTSLLLEARGFEKEDLFRSTSGNASIPSEDLAERDEHHDDDDDEEVLVFEFVDGGLKGRGKGRGGGDGGEREVVVMPRYTPKQVMGVVERRGEKFRRAVQGYLRGCENLGVDPEIRVKSERVIPERSVERQKEREKKREGLPGVIPTERKSMHEIVEELKGGEEGWYTGQIVPDGHRVFEAQEAVYGELGFLLSQDLVNALYNARGITAFYSHQAEAMNALQAGYDVVVSTSTSSGKSLIYQLPALRALEEDPLTRAMYIFPTKALAQDQRRSLRELMGYMPTLQGMMVETFDGDTPFEMRNRIREEARVIFTNPDMLHLTILPQEERWRSFLQNLRFVVVDELHVYNGLMGSHVAYVMRRLRRICAALGNRHELRFVSCSATVANPGGHFETIFGIEEGKVRVVEQDGSPSGRKEFLCWNTPYRDPGDPASGRGNAALECAKLFCQMILRGVRVIAFCRVRAQCEVLIGTVRQELERLGKGEVANRVMGYRGGYTAQDRRKIESEMFEGKLLGIVATTALELGVDIGTLDCVITWGFPYTISNLRQQSGRAGRRNKDSLSILVGDSFATDQHYMNNPDELFTKPNAALQVDLDNMLVKEGHIQCAAYELPIRPDVDSVYFGPDLAEICSTRLLHDPLTNFYHTADRFRPQPSKFVSIRDTEEDHFAIVDTTHNRNIVLEELDASRATFTLYDGAIFLHQGLTYLVRDFNPSSKIARVERVKVSWTTKQRDYTDIDPIETEALKPLSPVAQAFYGSIRITQTVFGFFKVDSKTNKILDAVAVDNPPVVRFTKGMWIDIPPLALSILSSRQLHVAGAIHAAQHALMSLIPNFVVSLPGDVRTECKNPLKELVSKRETKRKRPARLTFYDAKGGEGGSGINTKAFEHVEMLVRQALQRVERCECTRVQGCPECVASEYCKEGNEVVSKVGCGVVLKCLLGEEIDVEGLPMGPEEGVAAGVETVVRAEPVPSPSTHPALTAPPPFSTTSFP